MVKNIIRHREPTKNSINFTLGGREKENVHERLNLLAEKKGEEKKVHEK